MYYVIGNGSRFKAFLRGNGARKCVRIKWERKERLGERIMVFPAEKAGGARRKEGHGSGNRHRMNIHALVLIAMFFPFPSSLSWFLVFVITLFLWIFCYL